MLRRLGYRADVVVNGKQVLEALRRQRYDVVLMDVRMPEMDGLETTRKIRRRFSQDQGPRIIGMTAQTMRGDRERCLRAGMDEYLSKPVRLEELRRSLDSPQGDAVDVPLDPPKGTL